MAIGGLGKTMLGFADEVWEGMSKGVGDAAAKKVGGTILKSNMSRHQKAALRNLRRGVGDTGQAASRAVAYSKNVFKETKNNAIDVFQKAGRDDLVKYAQNMKGMSTQGSLNRKVGTRVGSARNTFGTRLGDNLVGGYRDTVKGMKGKDFSIANVKTAASAAFKNQDGSTNIGRVAGAVVTAGVVGRVATGGGLYRDRNGSFNVPGVPLI